MDQSLSNKSVKLKLVQTLSMKKDLGYERKLSITFNGKDHEKSNDIEGNNRCLVGPRPKAFKHHLI